MRVAILMSLGATAVAVAMLVVAMQVTSMTTMSSNCVGYVFSR